MYIYSPVLRKWVLLAHFKERIYPWVSVLMVVFGLMISANIYTEVRSIMKALVPMKLFDLVHLEKSG